MGKFKDANITEVRIFDDPSDTVRSDYRVALPITVTEAVIDAGTGMTLKEILAGHTGGHSDGTAQWAITEIDCGRF